MSRSNRRYAVAASIAVALLVAQRGFAIPAGVFFAGTVSGLVAGLTAAGIILVYRTTRVINFAHTAIGSAGALLTFELIQAVHAPFAVAVPLGLLVGTVVGVVFELVIVRPLFHAPRLVVTVATIAGGGLIGEAAQGVVLYVLGPFIHNLSADEQLGLVSLRDLLPFAGWHFQIGGFRLRFGFPEVFALELVTLCLFGLLLFLRATRAGVAVRAMAENADRAGMLGMSVGGLSSVVWGLSGLLGAVSVMLVGFLSTPSSGRGIAPLALLPAIAAAVLAGMDRLPTAVGASVGISLVDAVIRWHYPHDSALVPVALFVITAVGLFLHRRAAGRSEIGGGTTWEATDEVAPVPRELLAVPGVRWTRYALIALGLIAVAIYPFAVSTGATVLGGLIAINAIIVLSLVVLTGWAGQVSLGQYGLVAVGAVVAGALTGRVGIPFWLAVPVAAVATAAVAGLIGIPALRIEGLFLAAVTFAFGAAVPGFLFAKRYFGWLLPTDIHRPSLFFLDFEDERSMYFLCVAALVASIVAVVALRRSRFGRILVAVRDNEANAQSAGINVVRAKVIAFAVAGAIAGLGGALFAHQQRGLDAASYGVTASLGIFLTAVIGGVGTSGGALLGSLFFGVTNYFFSGDTILDFMVQYLRPFAVVAFLLVLPGGLVSLVARLRDNVLRIVAQRRGIVVPSLFKEFDASTLEHHLIPLTEASPTAGLATLAPSTDYRLRSELYGEPVAEEVGR